MFAILSLVVVCATVPAPGFTVHIREDAEPQRVIRMKYTGSDTVMDAVTSLKRPPVNLASMDMWIVRTSAAGQVRVLRIDWMALSTQGATATNFVLLPGDRLHIEARPGR